MKRIVLTILAVALTLAFALAAADPVLMSSRYTAYLGESSYLFLQDREANTLKRLPSPIADLIGMDESNLYCMTEQGALYAVKLDGSASQLISPAASAEQIASAEGKAAFTLDENGNLLVTGTDGSPAAVYSMVRAACTDGDILYYITAEANGSFLLRHTVLPSQTAPAEPRVEKLPATVRVNEPLSLHTDGSVLSLVDRDHAVTLIDLWKSTPAEAIVLDVPAVSAQTTDAVYHGGRLYRFIHAREHSYQLEQITDVSMQSAKPLTALAAPTKVPTVVPAATKVPTVPPRQTPAATQRPTATPKPTSKATSTPSDRKDGYIYFGDRGSNVRKMQTRLAELGYPIGKVDGAYGNDTQNGVYLFQDALGWSERKYMTSGMLKTLYSASAPAYDNCRPLKKGDRGLAVKMLQVALKDLGFNPGKLDGIYGKNTVTAVAAFQQLCGIPVPPNKVIGEEASRELLERLYSIDAPTAKPN